MTGPDTDDDDVEDGRCEPRMFPFKCGGFWPLLLLPPVLFVAHAILLTPFPRVLLILYRPGGGAMNGGGDVGGAALPTGNGRPLDREKGHGDCIRLLLPDDDLQRLNCEGFVDPKVCKEG